MLVAVVSVAASCYAAISDLCVGQCALVQSRAATDNQDEAHQQSQVRYFKKRISIIQSMKVSSYELLHFGCALDR